MKTKLKLLLFIPSFFFFYLVNSQENPTLQAYINFYVDEMEKLVDATGFTQLREQMIEEASTNESTTLTKEQYYKQLALLKVMIKKDKERFVFHKTLLERDYEKYQASKEKNNYFKENIWKEPKEKDSFLFYPLDSHATFPRCKKVKDNVKRRYCLSQNLTEHIQKKYDIVKAAQILRDNNIIKKGETNDLVFQTFVKLRITEDGEVEYIKGAAIHEDLDDLAEASLKGLPKLLPTISDGVAKNTIYTIPISLYIPSSY